MKKVYAILALAVTLALSCLFTACDLTGFNSVGSSTEMQTSKSDDSSEEENGSSTGEDSSSTGEDSSSTGEDSSSTESKPSTDGDNGGDHPSGGGLINGGNFEAS